MCNTILWLLALLVVTGHIRGDDPVTIEDDYMDAEIDGEEEVVVETVEDIAYVSPNVPDGAYFAEHFDKLDKATRRWVRSEAKKGGIDDEIAKYDGEWKFEAPERQGLRGDLGLVLKSKVKHSAISALLDRPFIFKDRPLVLQYEVLMQDKQECGGAYIKLLSSDKASADLKKFHDKTPYTIMFGPDKCGNDYKLHFIFRHKNPLNGSLSEKHCKKPKERIEEAFNDKSPHLYRLVLRPDNTFHIYLDHKVVNEGSLLEDFTPAVNPPAEIDDPTDTRPANWDEREKIPDPEAVKPEDWDEEAPEAIVDPAATKPDEWLDDEPETIPDPAAEKPSDWDSDMDGEWEAPPVTNPACEQAPGCGVWTPPTIPNPAYKGKWRSPLIDNPGYQGRWAPRRIPNPEFYEDRQPFRMTSVFAVGFELWSMSNMILFDNVLITDDPSVADAWAAQTFDLKKRKMEKESESLVSAILKYTNERPWLWAVYIVVIALPIVLILVFCCGSSSQEKEDIRQTGSAKKTDAVTADDVVDGEDELEGEVDEGGEESYSASSHTASKSTIAEEGKDSAEKASLEEEDPASASLAAGSGDAPASPRKRRTRKD